MGSNDHPCNTIQYNYYFYMERKSHITISRLRSEQFETIKSWSENFAHIVFSVNKQPHHKVALSNVREPYR